MQHTVTFKKKFTTGWSRGITVDNQRCSFPDATHAKRYVRQMKVKRHRGFRVFDFRITPAERN